jgi:hypothetical protein
MAMLPPPAAAAAAASTQRVGGGCCRSSPLLVSAREVCMVMLQQIVAAAASGCLVGAMMRCTLRHRVYHTVCGIRECHRSTCNEAHHGTGSAQYPIGRLDGLGQ